MENSNQKLGLIAYNKGLSAENIAISYLIKHKWFILHQRFQSPYGEIDLIAKKENWLLFAEVKARKNMDDALTAINLRQRQRLYKSATYFLELYHHEIEMFDLTLLE